MPCYTIETVSVSFKIGNIDLLKKAIEKAGYQMAGTETFRDTRGNIIKINMNTQTLTSQAYSERELSVTANILKRAYSELVIDEIAKKQKWIKKNMGAGQFQLQRY